MGKVVISGALANKYRNGGGAWERLSWVTGLRRLGFDVYFIEQIDPAACVDAAGAVTPLAESVNLAWFRSVTQWFGIADRSSLVSTDGKQWTGTSWSGLVDIASSAELLVNFSGHLTLPPLRDRIR